MKLFKTLRDNEQDNVLETSMDMVGNFGSVCPFKGQYPVRPDGRARLLSAFMSLCCGKNGLGQMVRN